MTDEVTRALAQGVLDNVHGPGHKMDCAAMLWLPLPDGGRTLTGTDDDRCNCVLRDANRATQELRQLAEWVMAASGSVGYTPSSTNS